MLRISIAAGSMLFKTQHHYRVIEFKISQALGLSSFVRNTTTKTGLNRGGGVGGVGGM